MTSALKTPVVAAPNLTLRQPEKADGLRVYELIEQSPPLDLNSCYSYLLHSWHFADTCILAEEGDILAGYISGYIPAQAARHIVYLASGERRALPRHWSRPDLTRRLAGSPRLPRCAVFGNHGEPKQQSLGTPVYQTR